MGVDQTPDKAWADSSIAEGLRDLQLKLFELEKNPSTEIPMQGLFTYP